MNDENKHSLVDGKYFIQYFHKCSTCSHADYELNEQKQ